MSKDIFDPWTGEQSVYADTIHEQEKPEISKLLGPDGRPLRYARIPIGFLPPSKRQ